MLVIFLIWALVTWMSSDGKTDCTLNEVCIFLWVYQTSFKWAKQKSRTHSLSPLLPSADGIGFMGRGPDEPLMEKQCLLGAVT